MILRTIVIRCLPLLFAAFNVNAITCLPIPSSTPSSCSNDYDLSFPDGDETHLISSVESGAISASIKYRFISMGVDAVVSVTWKDRNGAVLFSGKNQGMFDLFPSSNWDDYDWGETRYGLLAYTATKIYQGKAEFAVNSAKNVEPAGYHEFLPSPFGSGGGNATQRSAAPVSLAAATSDIPISDVVGAITLYDYAPGQPGNVELASKKVAVEFASHVEWDGTEYHYRYTVTNNLDDTLDVSWLAAELSGTLDAHAFFNRTFTSNLPPAIVQSQADVMVGFFSLKGGVGLLQPIPIPAAAPLFMSSLAGLLVFLSRSKSRIV